MSSSHHSKHATKNDQFKKILNFNQLGQLDPISPHPMSTNISGIDIITAATRSGSKSELEKEAIPDGSKRSDASECTSLQDERTKDVFLQTLIPFVIAGLGSICAGLLLNRVQKLPLVCEVPQFIAICPPLQGMKGNLDMTFTSRLSTEAHQGRFRSSGVTKHILMNIALLQAQAVAICLFAALVTFALDILAKKPNEEVPVMNFLFLGSSALFAMCLACMISSLGKFTDIGQQAPERHFFCIDLQ
ncbi:hypothetical protein Y032_0117g655 [Ancylostoma ceylanicum]|uniref:SLC41A/MgtE integral membrane domain-containing protein n=2 Tax=Ancylostoma ceylanicum TaxID=53326 RepID=A0A016TB50_9BILA|nr:hypothetical protein Y032_0117g655 [Ancylostoma ceylanicum]